MKQNGTVPETIRALMAKAKVRKVSIYTISRELGVSPATVSRVLNNHPAVSPEVRAQVQEVAERHNYKPRIVSSRVANLCVLVQQYDGHSLDFGAFLAQTLEGIAEYCRHEDLEMSVYSAHLRDLNEADVVRELRRRSADGAVVLRASDRSGYLNQLDEQRFPYFCLFANDGRMSDRLLSIDDEKLAYEAINHLIELGHRRIAILLGATDRAAIHRRLAGYGRAFGEHGLEQDERLVIAADLKHHHGGLQFGFEAVEALLAEGVEFTAVFTTCEFSARGVLAGLYRHRVAVPEEVSVVGFDDFPETAYLCPPLTTVRVPYLQFGYEAARQVHRLVRGLEILVPPSAETELRCELVVRESTGRARNC